MACTAGAKEKTALARHLEELKRRDVSISNKPEMIYPMSTVPLDALLIMKEVRPHQELLQDAILVEYQSNLGKAMFVSHQWLTATHPDPKFQQLKVLQTSSNCPEECL